MTLKIELIDGMKWSLNSVWAWGKWSQWVRKAKADDWHYATEEALGELKKKPKYSGIVDLHFKFYWKTRPLDSSNCSPMSKCVEDTLVREGVLEKDTNEGVRRVIYESVLMDKKARKELECDVLEVTIIPNG